MELKEGLEFYRKCLEHCDMVIANLYNSDLPKERKQALIDRQLDTRNMLKKRIEIIPVYKHESMSRTENVELTV